MDKEYNQVLNIYSVFKPQKKKKEFRDCGDLNLNREDIHWRAGSDGVCLVGKRTMVNCCTCQWCGKWQWLYTYCIVISLTWPNQHISEMKTLRQKWFGNVLSQLLKETPCQNLREENKEEISKMILW